MMMKKIFLLLSIVFAAVAGAQNSNAARLTATAMQRWPDSFVLKEGPARWSYDQGVILKGIEGLWLRTGNGEYFNYIQKSLDHYVKEDGSINGYRPDEYNLDHINNGKLLLTLFEVTGKEKYRKAADLLRSQLRSHPRTSEGGFWHKKVYPSQMWLDGLYMAEPFYAAYAKLFHDDAAFNDITRQFVLVEKHTRDPKTGLLYHGWDESRKQKWSNPETGQSPHFWGRALGWYGMALVDALDYYPSAHPGRDSLVSILTRLAKAITQVQDPKSGLWYDIVDRPKEKGNYLESSASCMLVYTLAKGVRKGYLNESYLKGAEKGYKGILDTFLTGTDPAILKGTVSVSGLGGNPYRDGSFAYYISEPVIENDPKGMGAFINAANEMEMLGQLKAGRGKTVMVDTYFNNEWKKDVTGRDIRFHYTWDDRMNSGFSVLGDIFNRYGVKTATAEDTPSPQLLSKSDIYLIVDPDTQKETPHPHFMTAAHADQIAAWVKKGGVLILMANDSGNSELKNFNLLSSRFGVAFNLDNFNTVQGNLFEQGSVAINADNPVFRHAGKAYIKELATLTVKSPAQAVLTKEGKTVAAVSSYGKGSVFIIGDPWLYNEYVDGRKLPSDFGNYQAAVDLVNWAISKSRK